MIELRRRWNNFKALPTKWAYRTLTRAMRRDPSYAHSWFCNISMPIYDEVNRGCVEPWLSPQESSRIADHLMRHLFGVENSSNPTGATNPEERVPVETTYVLNAQEIREAAILWLVANKISTNGTVTAYPDEHVLTADGRHVNGLRIIIRAP